MARKSFDEWMRDVDAAVARKCGMSHHDLPDCPYRDWYDDGVSAKSAAAKAVRMARDEM